MSLGPIDSEMANPPELVGPTSRRRGSPREEIPNVIAPNRVGDAVREDRGEGGRHAWDEHNHHQSNEESDEHPIIDELA